MSNQSTIGALVAQGVVSLQTGPFGSQLHSYDYRDEGIAVVPTEGIKDGRIDRAVLPVVSTEKARELARHRLELNDILFARRGVQATGRTAIIRRGEVGFLCGTGAIRLRVAKNQTVVDPRFLAWFLADPDTVTWIREQAIGATMPNLNEGIIRRVSVRLPTPDQQHAIASLLNALDDKIELNRRMNATLEEMARSLFRSWFVDFDPVHAKARGEAPAHMDAATAALFPDRFGDDVLPEGWSLQGLDEIANFLNGLALQKFPAESDEPSLPVIKIADLRNGPTDKSARASLSVPEKYIVRNGDVVFSWSGSLLQKVWTHGEGALNQHLFKVFSECVPKWFHFYAVDHHIEDFRAVAASKATTMGHIQRHHLRDAKIAVPDTDLMTALDQVVSPLFNRAIAADVESRTLASLRDTLLPKLMSGELRVRDAERQVAEAV